MIRKMQAVFDTLICFGMFVELGKFYPIRGSSYFVLLFLNSRIPEFGKV